jgi:signal transduction histidine kinase
MLVVGVALIGAALALVAVTEHTLESHVRSEAQLRAGEYASRLSRGDSPGSLGLVNEEDVFVQVFNASGRVLEYTPSLKRRPPLARIGPGESARVHDLPDEPDDSFLAVTEQTSDGRLFVLVARNLDSVAESVSVVANILLVGVPLLLIVVGFTTWTFVGRTLAPVEGIRAEVAAVSAGELHRRVPVPPVDDEISRLAQTMNEMLNRLDEGRRRQQQLVSDASHELRSPISAIRHHAEVARAHPDGTNLDELAADVLSESQRLERLAEDLLLLARADEHTLEMEGRPIDLDDLALEEARRLRKVTGLLIDTTGISAARTRGDRRQLQRVVMNLGDNAARHASAVIRLGVKEVGTSVVLEVDDDGPGVPAEMRSRVFERFTRLDDARDRRVGGVGLGLAIVSEIVVAHGGSVSVGDAPLGGARFSVILPTFAS